MQQETPNENEEQTRGCEASELGGLVMMPRHLTAENGAKAALMGEFIEWVDLPCPECADVGYEDDCHVCEGSEVVRQPVQVSWTTIKKIYDRAIEVLAT